MSLLNRKQVSIGRAERVLRYDRVFVVATEDTYAPSQYFEHLPFPRVKVVVLPTAADSGHSSPAHVVERLKEAFQLVRQRNQIQAGDEFWVFIDVDHHFNDRHLSGTLEAMQTAKQAGFEVAVSNPCFELWLLLHYVDVAAGAVFSQCSDVEKRLREILGQYNKASIRQGLFSMGNVFEAVRRARALDLSPNDPWPQQAGTRVYRLLERILPEIPPS